MANANNKISERQRQRHRRVDPAREPLRAAERAPGAEHEQQLPGEGIEHPVALRIGRDVPVEHPHQRVQNRGSRKRERGRAQQQPQYRRKPEQQHDVERQHVHIHRLELQQQRLKDGDIRMVEEIDYAHFFGIERIVE